MLAATFAPLILHDAYMTVDGWNPKAYEQSIKTARETVEAAAYYIVAAKQEPDWDSQRPATELIFYLAQVDYETKVLLHRAMESPDDRYVWEKYLGLHLHEVLVRVPRSITSAIQELKRAESTSGLSAEALVTAKKKLDETLRPIRTDQDFMKGLRKIRNNVAAHHFDKDSKTMDPGILWMLGSAKSRAQGLSLDKSQILEYSVTTCRAVQDFCEDALKPS